ncbi:hypothetical protein D3C72_1927090 [compost metagenome]
MLDIVIANLNALGIVDVDDRRLLGAKVFLHLRERRSLFQLKIPVRRNAMQTRAEVRLHDQIFFFTPTGENPRKYPALLPDEVFVKDSCGVMTVLRPPDMGLVVC